MTELQVTASGATPIQVMKVVRHATGLPLRDVKNMVDRPPFTLTTADKHDARALAAELERAGAAVAPPAGDALRDIERLADLLTLGVLTADEFAAAKQELLARV